MDASSNYYERKFSQCTLMGLSSADAAIEVIEAYLAGKPAPRKGKRKASDNDADFWQCAFLWDLADDSYESLPFSLALSNYLRQERVASFPLLAHVARVTPNVVWRSVRYSGLVLRQESLRWGEIKQLANTQPHEFGELVRICETFRQAHMERHSELESLRCQLKQLSPLELLVNSSLYAFENLLPDSVSESDGGIETQHCWEALNDILLWRLGLSSADDFRVTEEMLGSSLREHLSPFLFPSPEFARDHLDRYRIFGALVSAQLEFNSFMTRSVDAFCYDDGIRFEFSGSELVIVERDLRLRQIWEHNGEKLARLHQYWFYRAVQVFMGSGLAEAQMGRAENSEQNQLAYIKALRTTLRLTDVYGLGESLQTETGLRVDLFQALLSLELMSIFYHVDFVMPYNDYLNQTGSWQQALSRLAVGGLMEGLQNRFPITWSEKKAKIESIRPWTVSEAFPNGLAKAAEAILDFWTSDLGGLSSEMRKQGGTKSPELFERPILKMGRYLFQLPWMTSVQNNSSAAINNLRRLGARRAEARDETARIEQRLAEQLRGHGFSVLPNYQPVRTADDDPGEVDLICFRDGHVLVLEVKSTYLRRSLKDAWLHKVTTLRKAGLQLRRKVDAVTVALDSDRELASSLGIEEGKAVQDVRGWIVDTSLEHDHEHFSGFLKISVEEILIALRDDRHLLNDPAGMFAANGPSNSSESSVVTSLYPNDFSAERFINVIENGLVWESCEVQEQV
ncbi:hypothetical protein [Motiliproteus sediminis]|uniref:hypothetical protein n=1 Tax=Motiliproteus sediminis TaxID=1468178 RepID=UPI001AEFAA46|nr:hypothetical protein [Motiliproteus sediminis]